MTKYKIGLDAKTAETAKPVAKEILENTQKAMGMIPNMYLNMANSQGMLSTYVHGYKFFREESGFTSVEQEVVFLAVSKFNKCEYCVAAHSFVGDKMTNVPTEVTDAIREGRKIADSKLETLREFTTVMVDKRGWPSSSDVDKFLSAGFKEEQILEIVLAIAVKTISNYSNHIFHTKVDDAFANRIWKAE